MKIGVIGTIWLNTPPKNYGGTEEVVYNLVNGLTEKGHDVTFFGPATAKVDAKVVATIDRPLRDMNVSWTNFTYTLSHLTEAFDRANDFDVIHVHVNKSQDLSALPFSVYKNVPTLFTLHFPFPEVKKLPDKFALLDKYDCLPYTSISQNQQKGNLNYIANVYNSINIKKYPFVENPKDYFVWLGKINPIKGTKEAILAAKKAGVKLILMGVVEKGVPGNYAYFKDEILPLIDNQQIMLYENVGLPEKAILLGNAKGMLNPIQWEEPFGLVMIESQATGTPVIALKKGAVPEVVKDNQTGFVVSSLEEMVAKIKEIDKIDRRKCRNFVEETFSIEKMVKGYEKAYTQTIRDWTTHYREELHHIYQTIN